MILTKLRARAKYSRLLFFTLVGACLLPAGLSVPVASSRPLGAATRPNIVVIMTDDQTVEQLRVMSKVRALIQKPGTRFRNSFVSFPLCCPSRATFLTGQYPHNHGVFGNDPRSGGYARLDHGNTLPVWLRAAGYYTSHIGKYLNGYPPLENKTEVPPGWRDWQGLIGGAQMYDYKINDNGVLVQYGAGAADYQTDVLADRAVETIDAAALEQPFFLSIAPKAPHTEERVTDFPNPRPAPRHLGAFAHAPLPRPPSFDEADVSDKPDFVRNLPRVTEDDARIIAARYRSELASLLAVDDLIGRVVRKLRETGTLARTVIIFTSDNGSFHGEHRIKHGKVRVYEEASRVPLIVRGGGFPVNARANQLVSNVDLAPTILELAGAAPSLPMDGRSLLPLARVPSRGLKRNLLIETQAYQAVRDRSFMYVEHKVGVQELYDMRIGKPTYDPYQLQSRHADPAYD